MDLPALRVLYVEDNRINALLFEEAMRLLGGIELQVAEHGAEALHVVAHWTPQVLVLDANLPDMNGNELLRRLRRVPSWPVPCLHVLGRRHARGSAARPRQRLPGLLDQADRDECGQRRTRCAAPAARA